MYWQHGFESETDIESVKASEENNKDNGPKLKTLDYTFNISNTPTIFQFVSFKVTNLKGCPVGVLPIYIKQS